jgi:uncharacterized protein YaaN involved in tellurite resistance
VAADIDRQVEAFLEQVRRGHDSPAEHTRAIDAISSLGSRDVGAAAAMAGQILGRPAQAIEALAGGRGSVGGDLDELHSLANDLAEVWRAAVSPRRRLLGMLPPADPLEEFLDGWERVTERVKEVLSRLREAQQALRADSAAIAQERRGLATQVAALQRHEHMAGRIDAELSATADASTSVTDLVHAARQRRRDLLTQLAVTMQGEAALGIVEANNRELVNAIETAVTVTATALRNSAAVRQALLTQRAVRDSLADARRTAAAGGPALQAEALKLAWAGVEAALDEVDAFRTQASRELNNLL